MIHYPPEKINRFHCTDLNVYMVYKKFYQKSKMVYFQVFFFAGAKNAEK